MKIFYSKYIGLTLGWGKDTKRGDAGHRWDCHNYISISLAGNTSWKMFGWRCFTSVFSARLFLSDICWFPYVYSSWKDKQIARETRYIWLLFTIYAEIESLENVRAKWVHS